MGSDEEEGKERGMNDLVVSDSLEQFKSTLRTGMEMILGRVGIQIQAEAIKNAPRSAKMSQSRKFKVNKDGTVSLKKRRTKRQRAADKKRRNPRATTRAKPGGLEQSIDWDVNKNDSSVSIFVSGNSPAAKYAETIHDGKGVKWKNRGVGTQAKGERADDKYIKRAVEENEETARKFIWDMIDKAIRSFNT